MCYPIQRPLSVSILNSINQIAVQISVVAGHMIHIGPVVKNLQIIVNILQKGLKPFLDHFVISVFLFV